MTASPARAGEASNYCFWTILVESHALAVACGKPLEAQSEQRFRRIRKALESAIIRDAPLSPGGSSDKARSAMRQDAQQLESRNPSSCSTRDASNSIELIGQVTTQDFEAKMLSDLETPKDPYAGDCL
jgi:hypothetical protein